MGWLCEGPRLSDPHLDDGVYRVYIYIVEAMFVINAESVVCPSYYINNPRFEYIEGRSLFWFPPNIFDTLKYFGLYKFAHSLCTISVFTPPAFHRRGDVDWDNTAMRDGSFPTHFLLVGLIVQQRNATSKQARKCF